VRTRSNGTTTGKSSAAHKYGRHQPKAARTSVATALSVGVFAIPDHAAPRLVTVAGETAASRQVSAAVALAVALFAIVSALFVTGAARKAEA